MMTPFTDSSDSRKGNPLSRFFSNPAVGVTGTLASVVGVVLAVYFYAASVVRPDVTYYVNPIRASVVKAGIVSTLAVFHDDAKLASDVSAAQIAVWNRGKQAVKRNQILKPITFSVGKIPILEATIRKTSRDIVNLNLDRARLAEGVVSVSWEILEQGDGGIIQLIYAAGPDTPIKGDGIVEGQRTLSEAQFSGRLESPAEQYKSKLHSDKTTMWTCFGFGGLSLAVFLVMRAMRPEFFSARSLVDWIMFLQPVVLIGMGIYQVFTSRDVGPPFGFE